MRWKTLLACSIVSLGVAGLGHALAQQPSHMGPGQGPMMQRGPMGMGPMMGMMGGDCPMMGMTRGGDGPPAFAEGRIAFLKAELAITPQQQAAWDAYADAIKRNLESMRGMRQTMMTAMSASTPVERLEAHVRAMENRLKALNDVKPVLAKLYEALTADQKKKADELLTGMGCMT
jgi:hypothetical protein